MVEAAADRARLPVLQFTGERKREPVQLLALERRRKRASMKLQLTGGGLCCGLPGAQLFQVQRCGGDSPAALRLQRAPPFPGGGKPRLRRREHRGALGAFTFRRLPLGGGGTQALQPLHGFLQRLPLLGADRQRLQALLQLVLALLALGQKLTLPGHALPPGSQPAGGLVAALQHRRALAPQPAELSFQLERAAVRIRPLPEGGLLRSQRGLRRRFSCGQLRRLPLGGGSLHLLALRAGQAALPSLFRAAPGFQRGQHLPGFIRLAELLFQQEDVRLLRKQSLTLLLAPGALVLQLADAGITFRPLHRLIQPLAAVCRLPDRFLQPFGGGLNIRLACTAQPLLLSLQGPQGRLVLLDPAAELQRQPVAILLQMKKSLQHLPAVHAAQRQKFGKFPLRQHNGTGEIIHFEPDMLFHAPGNIRELVGHHMITVCGNLNETADRIAHRLVSGPFEFPFYPVTAGT
ncbi:hypothetical protein D3C73_416430 [compost metagenome]